MTLKLLIFISTCVCFLVHGSEVESRASSNDAESYITLEAAKELRNKLGLGKQHEDRQQDDYDEILKEIIRHLPKQQQPSQQPTEIFFEKKYFDYLPNEISDSDDITSEELSHELLKSEYASSEEQRQHVPHNERMKREISVQQAERNKRQSIYYAIPLTHYNPYPNVHFYYPIHDPIFNSFTHNIGAESRNDFGQALPSNSIYNNPWTPQNNPNMKFHAPNNFYLPPATPSSMYLPVGPTYQPPINVPQPPDNQLDTDNKNEPDDRISLFAGEDKYIIDSRPINTNQQSSSSGRRPASTTVRPYEQPDRRPNSYPVVLPDDKMNAEDLDIEFAPELQEDLTTTTRASIKIPERKNKNKQNNNRQKKSETTTVRSTATEDKINAVYSQQNYSNNRKPNKPLSACVEAIVNCCSSYDEIVRVPCFEAHNCNGAFFGRSPCSPTFPILGNLRDRLVTGPPVIFSNIQPFGRQINIGANSQFSINNQQELDLRRFNGPFSEVTVATSIDLKRPETTTTGFPKTETQKHEIDIEFAPELHEDLTTTTRASIVIPTKN
ncbi:hypothetical protein PVAND_000369 [Polypedilum vanderplanki]|uniref:Uncharacterized protein n=1 Tax=Polypedilum vanderplanki TaxID=319348 RepID=A0A9J6BJS7_POLVA|nr:hypothetical protein PVAND_000369 [Polypedilum vanderplanki]